MLTSRAFRAKLSEELPKWVNEGLISSDAEDLLRERYQLNEDGTAFAATAVYLLGALLVAGGVISFVAWNWAYLPDFVKLTGGVALLVATQIAGFVLWRVDGRRPALGHGLVFLGLLLFGANLGLFAQIYNVHDHYSGGVGAWALSALALALATRSLPCAAATVILAVSWALAYTDSNSATAPFVTYGVGIAIAVLAHRFRHPAVLVLATVGFVALVTGGALAMTSGGYPLFFAPLAAVTPLLALSLHEGWWASPLRRLGVGLFIALAFLASFGEIAGELAYAATRTADPVVFGFFSLPMVGIATGAALYRIARPRPLSPSEWTAASMLAASVVLFAVGASAGTLAVVLASHAGLIVLVALSIRRAIDELERAPFWLGVLVGGTLIMARFLEFETGLLLKAVLFTALGATVIVIGYAFESRRREVYRAS